MKKSAKLVFFGNERLATGVSTAAPALRALVREGYDIPAVISNYTPAVSRNDKGLEIVEVAHAYHIPVVFPDDVAKAAGQIKSYGAEIGVLVAFGKLVPKDVIDLFPKGIVNVHPSLLPAYRGSTPIETAILDGAEETGVSIMKLTAGMDEGPVFATSKVRLGGGETKQQLADKLAGEGVKLLIANLPAILNGELEPTPQGNAGASYTKRLAKKDGSIDWREPAETYEREIRAYLGYPKSTAEIKGQKVIISKARVAENDTDGQLVIECRPGYLEVLELIGPSGRTMSGADFLKGYGS